jgi:hypothetical protein
MDNKRKLKYERSIYRFFERQELKLINNFYYHLIPGQQKKDSAFSRWNDQSILISDVPPVGDKSATHYLLPDEIVNLFRLNGPTTSKYVELMQKFIRKDNITIYDIPLDLNEELMSLDGNEEVFFFTPILLFIIQSVVNDFLKIKK